MSLDFSAERWQRTIETSRQWWAGELERPLIHFAVSGRDPGRPEPTLPSHAFTAFYDPNVSAEAIVDRWDYDLSCREFLGDSYPLVLPNFGPGVIAAFLGALPENGEDTVWFHPPADAGLADIRFRYAPDNPVLQRIASIVEAATKRWEGRVQVAMTDLGGNLDVLSTFRPGEKLLLDLYDAPDDVKRLLWDAHALWWRYFDEFNALSHAPNPGYVAWPGIFSAEPHYMLQCDFAYMIGPDMFDEFVKPELVASCKRLPNAFYHLDGPGQLPHLDSLLAIPELKGIQWIPGAGSPDASQWPQVYRKIRDAGKLTQLYGTIPEFDRLVAELGSAHGMLFTAFDTNRDQAIACLKRYGAY